MKKDRRTKAFTLVELLTVIAIIGILAALLFPAIKSALLKAEATKAQSAIVGLSTAFRSYYTDYGKWPISDGTANQTYIVDTTFVALLRGVNDTAAPAPRSLGEPPFTGSGAPSSGKFEGKPR